MNTLMDGLVEMDAPEFDYTASGSGYIETAPLGVATICYVVIGYVSSNVRIVRASCTPKDTSPDPGSPGELVLCTFLPEGPNDDLRYAYQSYEKGIFEVTCRCVKPMRQSYWAKVTRSVQKTPGTRISSRG